MMTARQHHDRADREVDAGGQDDQGLRGADDADDGDLLEDQRQREGMKNLLPTSRPKAATERTSTISGTAA